MKRDKGLECNETSRFGVGDEELPVATFTGRHWNGVFTLNALSRVAADCNYSEFWGALSDVQGLGEFGRITR
jgi:hypothetical protein